MRKTLTALFALLAPVPPGVIAGGAAPAAEVETLTAQVAALRALIYDPAATFSASKTIAEINAAIERCRARTDAEAELRQLMILLGTVEYKRGDEDQARHWFAAALAMPAGPGVDLERETRDHYFLAEMASDHEDYALAATHYAIAARLAVDVPAFDANQRLGIREKHAFCLHEAGDYPAALTVNQALLADGEGAFGADDARLSTVLTNLAQNLYALGRKAEAEPFLVRNLAIVHADGDFDREQDMMFQLGVLTFELGRPAEARAYFTDRIALLERHGEAETLTKARADFAHFEDQVRAAPR